MDLKFSVILAGFYFRQLSFEKLAIEKINKIEQKPSEVRLKLMVEMEKSALIFRKFMLKMCLMLL